MRLSLGVEQEGRGREAAEEWEEGGREVGAVSRPPGKEAAWRHLQRGVRIERCSDVRDVVACEVELS
eukprot:364283-Chlamydomonas_euryale.AAC.12